MHMKYLATPLQIWQPYFNFPVKPASPHQRRVKDFLEVGSCHHNHTVLCPKTIHFHQQLVQGTFTLTIRTWTLSSFLTNCIQLVNKYY